MTSPHEDLTGSRVPRQLSTNELDQSRAPKRQKIEVACNVCKSRKSKCDGVRPVCGPCSRRKRGKDASRCEYRSEKPNDILTQRPESVSNDQRNAVRLPSALVTAAKVSSVKMGQRQDYTQQDHAATEGSDTLVPNNQIDFHGAFHEDSQAISDGSSEDRDVDAMGCVDNWGLHSGLLGASSGASFTRQIRKAADGTVNPVRGAKESRSDHVTTKLLKLRRKRNAERDVSDIQLVLPRRKTADHLFEVYWAYSDVIFPWLDEEEIRSQYASLWTPNDASDMDEKVFHCTLNLIFAVAAKLDPLSKPETRNKSANTFYGRARDLLSFNLLDISHFQILQTLLLAAQYLQSTNMPRQCYQTIGLAVWVAQDLGLHLPETTCMLKDPSERELARRVWHGCILMDKIGAMTFGRPARISKAVVDRAVYPHQNGYARDSRTLGNHPTDHPAKLSFFIAFCNLHHILGDVLEIIDSADDDGGAASIRRPNPLVTVKRIDQLFEIDHSLSSWYDGLSSHLKVPLTYIDDTETRYITRQANILYARYQYLRLLLFRPFLTQARQLDQSKTTNTSSLESQVTSFTISECQVRCVRAAQEIMDLITNNLVTVSQNPKHDVLPSWWYTISYIFTSGLVLIAAQMIPSISDIIPTRTLNLALERCYQALQQYNIYTKAARRCSSVLKSVQKTVTSPRPAGQTTTQQMSYRAQLPTNYIEGGSIDIGSDGPELDFSSFNPSAEDFAWLETNLFDWDDGSWSLNSFDPNVTDGWQ